MTLSDTIDRRFNRLHWQMSLTFSLFFLVLILIYTLLLQAAHRSARLSFDKKVSHQVRGEPPPPVITEPPVCQPPDVPYDPPVDKVDGEQLTGVIKQNFETYQRRVNSHLLIFDGLIWLLASVSGYFFVGWLLRPARRAAQAQNDFLANASHELKTPLTTIKTELSLMKEQRPTDWPASWTVIETENKALEALVENLLLSLQHEKLPNNLTNVDLKVLLTRLSHQFAKVYRQQHLTFQVQTKVANWETDETKLTALIKLLLDNAGKYATPHSSVGLESKLVGKKLLITVANQGIGIANDQKEVIFQRFYRVTDRRIQAQSGSGLGLAIARDLARELGGELTLLSGDPKATTFGLSLPKP